MGDGLGIDLGCVSITLLQFASQFFQAEADTTLKQQTSISLEFLEWATAQFSNADGCRPDADEDGRVVRPGPSDIPAAPRQSTKGNRRYGGQQDRGNRAGIRFLGGSTMIHQSTIGTGSFPIIGKIV